MLVGMPTSRHPHLVIYLTPPRVLVLLLGVWVVPVLLEVLAVEVVVTPTVAPAPRVELPESPPPLGSRVDPLHDI